MNDQGDIFGGSVINLDVVRSDLTNLLTLYRSTRISDKDLSEAIIATAEKAGLNPGALRRFVAARAGEEYDEKRAESAQLQLMFEELE